MIVSCVDVSSYQGAPCTIGTLSSPERAWRAGRTACGIGRGSRVRNLVVSSSRPFFGSAERERKRLHACIEKRDLEQAISDVPRLPDQLIQPLLGHRAVALLVNVTAV